SGIAVDAAPSRLAPPASLSAPERRLFRSIVAGCDRKHFRQTDRPLLARYCEAACLAEHAALELRKGAVCDGKVSPWITIQEKQIRALVSLSMRLRLAPQSSIDPKTLGREQQLYQPLPWDRTRARGQAKPWDDD